MLTPDGIRRKALRKWPEYREHLLKAILMDEDDGFFPLTVRGDTSLTGSFSESADAYALLLGESRENKGRGYTLVWNTRNVRGFGSQSEIRTVLIETEEDYLHVTEKEGTRKAICTAMESLIPLFDDKAGLYHWATNNTRYIETEDTDWASVNITLAYFMEHRDNSSCYMRELPVRVHTKFIEENSSLLISLFSALTGETFPTGKPEDVFRLRKKPLLIRFRMKSGKWVREEMAVPLTSFSVLEEEEDLSEKENVFVIENEAVYLSFPVTEKDICIFGGGFQATVLNAPWMESRNIYYFGDLDEHGLEILSLFRSRYPKTESLMMDEATYSLFRDFSVKGVTAESETAFSGLTEEEKDLLQVLRANAPEHNRLEQERIPQEYIRKALREKCHN